MKLTNFYSDLLRIYSQIYCPPEFHELSKVDKFISYYLADIDDQFISARQDSKTVLVELDIQSAFPTICHCFFESESEFIKKMNSIDDKRGKLIYIATTLKQTGDDYLVQFNIICKMVIMGLLLSLVKDELRILEIKKDGALFTCSPEDYERLTNLNCELASFLIDNNFNFHLTKFDKYYRCFKTSVLKPIEANIKEDEEFKVSIKGKYKYIPPFVRETITKILTDGSYNSKEVKRIYSPNYLSLCTMNGLNELLNEYYMCDNGCVINTEQNYVKYNHMAKLDPMIYLSTFIYPAILSIKI